MRLATLRRVVAAVAAPVTMLSVLMVVDSRPASAETTLTASGQGWYQDTGLHQEGSGNYVVGGYASHQYRDFFVFSVPSGLSCPLASATLRIPNPSANGTGTLSLYQVTTATSSLTADYASGSSTGQAIYADLGDGTVYGSTAVTDPTTNPVDVTFNAAGLAALSASRGGSLAVGGDYPGGTADLFASTSNTDHPQLILACAGSWSQAAEKYDPAGGAYQFFGETVALDGSTALVGSDFASGSGAAWVYTGSGSTWTQQAKLSALGSTRCFGSAVALSGTTALVADQCDNSSQGAVYVFTGSGSTWTQSAKLTVTGGSFFGTAVATNGSAALISNGSTNQVFVFTNSRKGWSQTQTLTAAPSSSVTVGDFGTYANTVAMFGNVAVIGAPASTVNGNSGQGAAYVFQPKGKRWTQTAVLTTSGVAGDNFGVGVATDGTTIVVGADVANKAYVFNQTRRAWSQTASLTGPSDSSYGYAVAVSGANVIVGAWNDGSSGSAFAYRSDDGWSGVQQLVPESGTGVSTYEYGYSVALSGATAWIGAPDSYVNDTAAQGAGYVFTFS